MSMLQKLLIKEWNMFNDNIALIKSSGDREDGINASVQGSIIYTKRTDIMVEPHDHILRRLPNGSEEQYEVLDPVFHTSPGGNSSHYEIKCRKLGVASENKVISVNTFHVSGNNARINSHSTDNSINSVNINPEAFEQLERLRGEVTSKTSGDQQIEALEKIEFIESQLQSGQPSKTLIQTVIASLPQLGNIASIGSFLIAALGS